MQKRPYFCKLFLKKCVSYDMLPHLLWLNMRIFNSKRLRWTAVKLFCILKSTSNNANIYPCSRCMLPLWMLPQLLWLASTEIWLNLRIFNSIKLRPTTTQMLFQSVEEHQLNSMYIWWLSSVILKHSAQLETFWSTKAERCSSASSNSIEEKLRKNIQG